MTITATMEIVPNSRTPENGSAWRATCEWDGRRFGATSRTGASNALCRELVKAGCPDQAMAVHGPDGKLRFTLASIHRTAKLTYAESSKRGLRATPYQEWPRAVPGNGEGSALDDAPVGDSREEQAA